MMAERRLGIPSLFLAFEQGKKRRGSDKSNATTPIISPAAAEAVRDSFLMDYGHFVVHPK